MRKILSFGGIALAVVLTVGAAVDAKAALVSADTQQDFETLGIGAFEGFFTEVSGSFTHAYAFDLAGVDVTGATVAINLDFPSAVTISEVSLVRGTRVAGPPPTFSYDDPADVLASTALAGVTILATLLELDEPFAVIVKGSGGPGSYSGTLELAAVPIPGAVWLFGSGLLALLGVGYTRRRQAAA